MQRMNVPPVRRVVDWRALPVNSTHHRSPYSEYSPSERRSSSEN